MLITYFITPHGYGHATRSIAIMQAITAKAPNTKFIIITSLSEQIFADTDLNYQYIHTVTDVGLAQTNAFNEDINKTIHALEQLIPYQESLIQDLAAICKDTQMVLCDISALGIAVAKEIGVPSVLVSNFTWDWIYTPYLEQHPELKPYADYFKACYLQADFHIQLQPFCVNDESADLIVPPVFRPSTRSKEEIFADLPIQDRPIILVTLGGIATSYDFIQRLKEHPEYFFIIPSAGKYELQDNYLLLPAQTHYHHPDLIHAANVVICKTGYSTISEIYHSGVPLGFVSRDKFPESLVIEAFIDENLSGFKLNQKEFETGDWLNRLPKLLQLARRSKIDKNGADDIADFLLKKIRA